MIVYSGKAKIGEKMIPWQTTFSTDVRFACQSIGYCCTSSNVRLNFDDIERISKEKRDFIEFDTKGPLLKGTTEGRCPFLSNANRCRIYKDRPFVCKSYPFYLSYVEGIVYIDVLQTCCAIYTNNKKNDIDFGQLVCEYFRAFNNAIPSEDDIRVDHKRWDALIDRVDMHQSLLGMYEEFNPGDKPSFPLFVTKFFSYFREFINAEKEYIAIELPTRRLYPIFATKDAVVVDNKVVAIASLREIDLSREAKEELKRYLKTIWRRVGTRLDLKQVPRGSDVFAIQVDAGKRFVLLIQFLALVIATKKQEKEISYSTIRETIFTLDASLFTPLDEIAQSRKKNFFREG